MAWNILTPRMKAQCLFLNCCPSTGCIILQVSFWGICWSDKSRRTMKCAANRITLISKANLQPPKTQVGMSPKKRTILKFWKVLVVVFQFYYVCWKMKFPLKMVPFHVTFFNFRGMSSDRNDWRSCLSSAQAPHPKVPKNTDKTLGFWAESTPEQCSKPWLFRVYRGLYYPVILGLE